MKLDKTCKTCEFASDGICMDNSRKKLKDVGCEEWGASLEYYSEITETAPWYIKEPYKKYEISYGKFLDYIKKDSEGIGIKVNIYDAIEKIYDLSIWDLAGVLDVSIGVIGYARSRGTIEKRKKYFASKLHIPESFFDDFLSTQLEELVLCRDEFYEFYGKEMIEKFKQRGKEAMDKKWERDIAISKVENEKYWEENKHKYQYRENDLMYHDLSDDYKSRDYVVAIKLKDGDYYGDIFYEYMSYGYGLSISVMKNILDFVENLDCEEISLCNEEGGLYNNINLQADINAKEIYFQLKNKNGEVLEKTVPQEDLQKYIIGYEMIRCDGHGMKKERRKCESCQNFHPIEGGAKGNCIVRGDVIYKSKVICAFHYVPKEK